jgi:hypothetical protein
MTMSDIDYWHTRRIVGPPASSLFIVAAASAIASAAWGIQNLRPFLEALQQGATIGELNHALFAYVFGLPASLVVLALPTMYGAWQMRRCRSRRWSYAACLLSLLPQPFWIVSAPLALWGLWALRRASMAAGTPGGRESVFGGRES